MIPYVTRLYSWIRWLSLDIVAGAMATAWMLTYLLEVQMPWSWWTGLPIGVWVYYTADHLFDAYKLGDTAHTQRHRFHARHFQLLMYITGISVLLGFLISLYLPAVLWYFAIGVGLLGLIHLSLAVWLRHTISFWLQKELGVAMVYTLGIWGGPYLIKESIPYFPFFHLLSQFFLLALINLLIFSTLELETDILDGHTSFIRAIGKGAAFKLTYSCLMLLGISGTLAFLNPSLAPSWKYAEGLALGMGGVLLGILLYADQLKPSLWYRILGDAVFVLPALLPLLGSGFPSLFSH